MAYKAFGARRERIQVLMFWDRLDRGPRMTARGREVEEPGNHGNDNYDKEQISLLHKNARSLDFAVKSELYR